MSDVGLGIAVAVAGGAVGSSTLMPIKYVRAWNWENTWLVYSFFAYFLFPWLNAIVSVPHLFEVYRSTAGAASLTALFGLGWGVGVVMYGLALDMVGLSLSSGIILGSSVALGSLIPLLALDASRILTLSGAQILGADAVMIAGVILCARAGGLRERAIAGLTARVHDRRFLRGLVICFLGGMLSPLLNVALTYGAPVTRKSLQMGANPLYAANGVWGLAVSMGALPSILFCVMKLGRNGTWPRYRAPGGQRNLLLCFTMGVFFMASTAIYGTAAGELGPLGPVVGWPIYMSALILGNNFWGWFTGEWKGISGPPVWTMFTGIALQVAAAALLGTTQL